jgi:hypothetical protein
MAAVVKQQPRSKKVPMLWSALQCLTLTATYIELRKVNCHGVNVVKFNTAIIYETINLNLLKS